MGCGKSTAKKQQVYDPDDDLHSESDHPENLLSNPNANITINFGITYDLCPEGYIETKLFNKDLQGGIKALENEIAKLLEKKRAQDDLALYEFRLGICYYYNSQYYESYQQFKKNMSRFSELKGNTSEEATRAQIWYARAMSQYLLTSEDEEFTNDEEQKLKEHFKQAIDIRQRKHKDVAKMAVAEFYYYDFLANVGGDDMESISQMIYTFDILESISQEYLPLVFELGFILSLACNKQNPPKLIESVRYLTKAFAVYRKIGLTDSWNPQTFEMKMFYVYKKKDLYDMACRHLLGVLRDYQRMTSEQQLAIGGVDRLEHDFELLIDLLDIGGGAQRYKELIKPKDAEKYYRILKTDEALEIYDKIINKLLQVDCDSAYQQAEKLGQIYEEKSQFGKALKKYQQAVQGVSHLNQTAISEDEADLLGYLSCVSSIIRCCSYLNNEQLALRFANEVLVKNEEYGNYLINICLGDFYDRVEKVQEASQYYSKGLKCLEPQQYYGIVEDLENDLKRIQEFRNKAITEENSEMDKLLSEGQRKFQIVQQLLTEE